MAGTGVDTRALKTLSADLEKLLEEEYSEQKG